MNPELGARLKAVLSLCEESFGRRAEGTIADIGCDHGFVAAELIRRKIAARVLAADLRKGPLESARRLMEREGLLSSVELVLSDGFSSLPKEPLRGAVLCGMGGRLMASILEKGAGEGYLSASQALILGPQSEVEALRRSLQSIGFGARRERIVREGKHVYPLLEAVPEERLRESRLHDREFVWAEEGFFPLLIREKNAVYHALLIEEQQRLRELLLKDCLPAGRKKELEQRLQLYEEIKGHFV